MNELPKSVRDELARKSGSAQAHPDANLLTAYSEGTATPAERAQIEQHLATCEDCREVLFLATPEIPAEVPVVVATKPRTRWVPVWAPWAAAAAVLIVATVTYTRHSAPTQSAKLSQNRPALSAPAPTQKSAEVATPKEALREVPQQSKAEAKTGITPPLAAAKDSDAALALPTTGELKRRDGLKKAESLDSRSGLSDYAAINSSAGASPAVAPPPPAQQQVYAARSRANAALKPGPAAPAQNQMQNQATQNVVVGSASQTVEVTSEAAPLQKSQVSGTLTTAEVSSLKRKATTNWRISASGAVERELSPGNWETALTKPDTEFTVVAVIGPDIWAGGTHGTLNHSVDGGNTWRPVFLPGVESQTIVAIEFRDVWHGVITSADHHSWATADRGTHWQQH